MNLSIKFDMRVYSLNFRVIFSKFITEIVFVYKHTKHTKHTNSFTENIHLKGSFCIGMYDCLRNIKIIKFLLFILFTMPAGLISRPLCLVIGSIPKHPRVIKKINYFSYRWKFIQTAKSSF